jgi:chemotaxis protein MotB
MIKIRSTAYLFVLAIPFVFAGCVSIDKYEALQKENKELISSSLFLSSELMEEDKEVQLLQMEQEALLDEVARWAVAGAVKMELMRSGLQITLPNDVLFASGSANLKPEGQSLIGELVSELEGVPYQIVVLGHTDNVSIGPELAERYPSNWELAGARAASVVRTMAAAGVPSDQLVAVSNGDTRPIASNDTAAGRKQNRRIEVRLRPVVIQ